MNTGGVLTGGVGRRRRRWRVEGGRRRRIDWVGDGVGLRVPLVQVGPHRGELLSRCLAGEQHELGGVLGELPLPVEMLLEEVLPRELPRLREVVDARCGEMRGDVGRCGEMWGDAGRFAHEM